MSQTKRHSLIEALFNVLIGYGISCAANMVVMPMYGYQISTSEAMSMGLIFTVISIVRSYALRRLFNRITYAKTHA